MARTEAERIQAEYLGRLRRLLRRAPADVRDDALREVQSHIEDEWHALGGDLPALQAVLQRLGPPEAYGRDLALHLLMSPKPGGRSIGRLAAAAVFWASTSLIGAVVVVCAALVLAFAVGMLLVAAWRLRGLPAYLVEAVDYKFLSYHVDRLRFPPDAWSPALIATLGLLPALVTFVGLYRLVGQWLRSRLAGRGLALVMPDRALALPSGWERRALLAMAVIAVLGLGSCMLFSILGELLPIGRGGQVSLPQDFFRSPLTALAFLGGLVFLTSPVLGLLWMARRMRPNTGPQS